MKVRCCLKHGVAAAVVVVVSLVVGATPFAAAATKSSGGTLTIATGTSPTTFSPVAATLVDNISSTTWLSGAIYGALVYHNVVTGAVDPGIAQSLTTDSAATTWTLKLRPDVKFTDGTALNASAVVANWDWSKTPAAQIPGNTMVSTLAQMASYNATDNETVRIVLKVPNASFDRTFADRLPFVASPAALTKFGNSYGTSPETTVGAGPFILTKFVRDSTLELTKNPNYWQKGFPKLDKYDVLVSPDPETRLNMVQTGQADYTYNVNSADWVVRAKSAGLRAVSRPANSLGTFFVQPQKSPTDLPEVRKALQIAIDPKQWNAVTQQGTATVATNLYQKGSIWHVPGADLPPYNKKKAQQLFNQAAAKLGGPVVVALTLSPTVQQYGAFVTSLLAQYDNLEIRPTIVQSAQFTTAYREGDWNLIVNFVPIGDDPFPYLADNLLTGSPKGVARANDPVLDGLINQGLATTKKNERVKIWNQAAKRIIDNADLLFVPVYTGGPTVVLGPRVKDYSQDMFYNNFQALQTNSKG